MIEIENTKLIAAIDLIIGEQIARSVHPEIVAGSVLKMLDPQLFIDSSSAASIARKQFVAAYRPLVEARLALRRNEEFDAHVEKVFAGIAQACREVGEQPTAHVLVHYSFRVLHADLLGLAGKQAEYYRKERAAILLCRAINYLESKAA